MWSVLALFSTIRCSLFYPYVVVKVEEACQCAADLVWTVQKTLRCSFGANFLLLALKSKKTFIGTNFFKAFLDLFWSISKYLACNELYLKIFNTVYRIT